MTERRLTKIWNLQYWRSCRTNNNLFCFPPLHVLTSSRCSYPFLVDNPLEMKNLYIIEKKKKEKEKGRGEVIASCQAHRGVVVRILESRELSVAQRLTRALFVLVSGLPVRRLCFVRSRWINLLQPGFAIHD
jgi:hypothetical protein